MISIITYAPRQPLVTKAKQIYSITDRSQNQQRYNSYNSSILKSDKTSPSATFELYAYGYETKEQQRSMVDIRI